MMVDQEHKLEVEEQEVSTLLWEKMEVSAAISKIHLFI